MRYTNAELALWSKWSSTTELSFYIYYLIILSLCSKSDIPQMLYSHSWSSMSPIVIMDSEQWISPPLSQCSRDHVPQLFRCHSRPHIVHSRSYKHSHTAHSVIQAATSVPVFYSWYSMSTDFILFVSFLASMDSGFQGKCATTLGFLLLGICSATT